METKLEEGLCHAESSHHETFVNESIFTYICRNQSSGRWNFKLEIKLCSRFRLGKEWYILAKREAKPDMLGYLSKCLEKVGVRCLKLKLPQSLSRSKSMDQESNGGLRQSSVHLSRSMELLSC
ncbi:hypothetical protein Tco_1568222 [Tanacetum coccineum]